MAKQNKAEKSIVDILTRVNDIMRNQFIIDLMILVQGINFIIHPENAHKGIIESFAITVFFATISILIGFLISHSFKKQNFRSIMLAFVFMILSIIAYFEAGALAPVFHYFLAITIIVSGIINILRAYHLIKLSHIKKSLKSTKKPNTTSSVKNALERNVKLESERVLSPAVIFSGKISKFRYGQLLVNFILIATGIAMFFFRFQTNAILIRVSGAILIFSAISDFIALVWTHHESSFVKGFTHYNNPSR